MKTMIELTRSHNVFELKLIKQKLEEAGIQSIIMDEHTGSLMHGLGNIYPRLMVLDEDLTAAQETLRVLEDGES